MSALEGYKLSKSGGKNKPTQKKHMEELMRQFPD